MYVCNFLYLIRDPFDTFSLSPQTSRLIEHGRLNCGVIAPFGLMMACASCVIVVYVNVQIMNFLNFLRSLFSMVFHLMI